MQIAQLLSKGLAFQKQANPRKAERFYRRVLAQAPRHFDALYLLGVARAQQNDLREAIELFTKALAVDPASATVQLNLATTLKMAGRHAEAIEAFNRSLALVRSAPAYAGLGDSHRALQHWREAIRAYSAALDLNPKDIGTLSVLIETKRTICDWAGIEALERRLVEAIKQTGEPVNALLLLNVEDDPALQCANTRAFIERTYPGEAAPKPRRPAGDRTRIRLGYFSSDFRDHAISFLAARLFELHDRAAFEVIGISHGPRTADRMRTRIEAAFDRFVDISQMSASEALSRVAGLDLDLAVDLNGHTLGARLDLFAARVAPVQITYLGYPGTSGARFFDYALVDPYVAPEHQRAHFTEALAILPHCYQCNDNTREIAGITPSRSEAGLPDDAFVFCCFNKPLKITPAMFRVWAGMLKSVPGSVLWMFEESSACGENLRLEAERLGLEPDRLVFARPVPHAQHLARQRLADLFLDTLPYNAHTTASDALWAGLPVLTCPGRSFASRVAGSLLQAIGLPEMIAPSMAEYEAMGVRLAQNPDLLAGIREKLARNRLSTPLFDSQRSCTHIEEAYRRIWARYCAGAPPESFSVSG